MKKYILMAGLALGATATIITTTQSCVAVATTVGLTQKKKNTNWRNF